MLAKGVDAKHSTCLSEYVMSRPEPKLRSRLTLDFACDIARARGPFPS